MDEQIKPVAWVERTEAGLTRMWSSDLSAWAERPANPEPLYPQQSIDALRAEVERLRADAERYRWLCDGNGYFMEECYLCGHENEKARADAAIDAARKGAE